MTNLTLSIEEETLKQARIRALEQGTSVNAVVRRFLETYAGSADERRARERFVELASGSGAGLSGKGRSWNREDLYEDRLG